MRVKIGAVIAVVALLCAGCDWTQFVGGANHSNTIYDDGLTTATIGSLVSSTFASTTTTAEVVTANGLVYAERDGALTVYDATTSGVVWSATLPPGTTGGGAPAVDPGSNTVFVVVAGAANLLLVGYDGAGAVELQRVDAHVQPDLHRHARQHARRRDPARGRQRQDLRQRSRRALRLRRGGADQLRGLARHAGLQPAVGQLYQHLGRRHRPDGLQLRRVRRGEQRWCARRVRRGNRQRPLDGPGRGFRRHCFGEHLEQRNGLRARGRCHRRVRREWLRCGILRARHRALARRAGDAAGQFFSTPATDGATVVATNGNGFAYVWPQIGCSASACSPQAAAAVNTPGAGSFGYAESPAVTNGVVYLLAQRAVSGVDHLNVVVLDEATLASRASWDLGTAGLAPGLTGVSIANGVVYAAELVGSVHAAPTGRASRSPRCRSHR